MFKSLLIFLFLFFFLCSALAKNSESNSNLNQTLSSGEMQKDRLMNLMSSPAFTKTGETTFSILFWDLYTSQLLTTSGRYPLTSKDESLIFHINYLADISSEDLIMRTVEQWQHLGIQEHQYRHYLSDLTHLWPDISDGDSLALLVENDRSVFYFNDRSIGSIDDPNFGPLFVDIWLSKGTSQPKLRAELLGDSYEK